MRLPLLLAMAAFALRAIAGPISLVPLPVDVQPGEGTFIFPDNVSLSANTPEARGEAERLSLGLRRALDRPLPVAAADNPKAAIRLRLDPAQEESCGEEGYHLRVSKDGIDLVAAHAAGLFYAGQTLRQLLPPAALAGKAKDGIEWSVPCVTIHDRPRFAWRGFMLDESRHFFGADYVKHLLDVMASQKLNTFHWHLSDDDGWRIEIKSWPKLTEVGAWRGTACKLPNTREGETFERYGGFYTQEQIREIVAYAAARHIRILPEIDLPGHCLAVATAYPETLPSTFDGSVSAQGVRANALSPASETTYKLVDDVFREMAGLFPFPFIHIGGDEVNHQVWAQCPRIKELMQKEKLPNLGAAQNYFTRRLEAILAQHGRRVVGWNEILGQGQLRGDTTIMSWTGIGPGLEAAKKGHPVVMAPGPFVYLDMGYGGPNEPKSHWWAGLIETEKTYSLDPVSGGDLTPEQQKNIIGAHAALWTEFVTTPEGADYKIFPRLSALAEVAWTPQNLRTWESFRSRLGDQLERLHHQGVAFRVPPPSATYKDGTATLVPPFPGAEMRYTLDATPPTVSSPRYEGPVETADPAKLRYVTVMHGRPSPARNGAAREPVARWKPSDLAKDWKTLDFDVTSAITADGVHRACFEFTGGACKLVVRNVELLRDGSAVARDDHEGETGSNHKRNIWRLPVSGHKPGVKYTLRAEARPDGGTDSSGGISIERAAGLEPEVQVKTDIPHYTDNKPENLTDWDPGTFFWSSRPLGDGDKVDFVFAQAQPLKHIEVATGMPEGNRDQIQNAVVEVSENGSDFRQVAAFSYGSAKADLDGKPVKAVRFRVTGPHQTWCVLRDLVVR